MARNVIQRLANAIDHSSQRIVDSVDIIPRRTKVVLPSGKICTTQYMYYFSLQQDHGTYWVRKANFVSLAVNNFVVL